MPALIAGRSTRMEVLEFLRRKQAASAEVISAQLGITPNAVRQHLAALEKDGLVMSEPVQGKRGRPRLMFSLTDKADAAFPKRYGKLATMVLNELEMLNLADETRVPERLAMELGRLLSESEVVQVANQPPLESVNAAMDVLYELQDSLMFNESEEE